MDEDNDRERLIEDDYYGFLNITKNVSIFNWFLSNHQLV